MKQTITIGGREYPCRITMGAMRRFRQRTGVEIADVGDDALLFVDWVWCCIDSACRADGRSFDIADPDALADTLTPDELQRVVRQFAEATGTTGALDAAAAGVKKKAAPQPSNT